MGEGETAGEVATGMVDRSPPVVRADVEPTGRILRGKVVADAISASVAERAASLRERGIQPHLVFVTVGESAESHMYVQRLQRLGERVGVTVVPVMLDNDVFADDLVRRVGSLNDDAAVDGVVVQMPLPLGLRGLDLSSVIDPGKDVDGVTVENGGRLYLGLPGHRPSTAQAMVEILDHAGVDPLGKAAVVVGRSSVVGHPVAEMMLHRHATVTITHSRTRDLGAVTREAEILLVATGRANLIRGDMIQSGVVIVDAGINVTQDGKVVGDVAFDECLPIAAAITPVPGGVGPVTNAVLLRSVIDSADRRIG
jgi:methylenetetrahydrofolate dehydrogenase (NADP+)/methenyltetrahydrofolate cyclohydrolase